MAESLLLYFKTLVRPGDQEPSERNISYIEVLGISWALHFIYTFYSILALFIGVRSYEYFAGSKDFTHLMLNSFSFSLNI